MQELDLPRDVAGRARGIEHVDQILHKRSRRRDDGRENLRRIGPDLRHAASHHGRHGRHDGLERPVDGPELERRGPRLHGDALERGEQVSELGKIALRRRVLRDLRHRLEEILADRREETTNLRLDVVDQLHFQRIPSEHGLLQCCPGRSNVRAGHRVRERLPSVLDHAFRRLELRPRGDDHQGREIVEITRERRDLRPQPHVGRHQIGQGYDARFDLGQFVRRRRARCGEINQLLIERRDHGRGPGGEITRQHGLNHGAQLPELEGCANERNEQLPDLLEVLFERLDVLDRRRGRDDEILEFLPQGGEHPGLERREKIVRHGQPRGVGKLHADRVSDRIEDGVDRVLHLLNERSEIEGETALVLRACGAGDAGDIEDPLPRRRSEESANAHLILDRMAEVLDRRRDARQIRGLGQLLAKPLQRRLFLAQCRG